MPLFPRPRLHAAGPDPVNKRPNAHASVRKQLREQRAALSEVVARDLSRRACRHLLAGDALSGCRRIGAYLAVGREADPRIAMDVAVERGIEVRVPVLTEGVMRFVPWTPDCEVRHNRFGIEEPVHAPAERCEISALDLVIMPLVAFDPTGNRIGMGGGYYDRSLAGSPQRADGGRPMRVGIAYDLQRVESIVANPWDVPMDAMVTESGWYDARN